MHRETWYALSAAKNDNRYREYIDSVSDEELKGGIDVCVTLDFYETKGREEGREEGINKGIQTLIETCHDFGTSQEVAVNKLVDKFQLSEEEAETWMKKYWK